MGEREGIAATGRDADGRHPCPRPADTRTHRISNCGHLKGTARLHESARGIHGDRQSHAPTMGARCRAFAQGGLSCRGQSMKLTYTEAHLAKKAGRLLLVTEVNSGSCQG